VTTGKMVDCAIGHFLPSVPIAPNLRILSDSLRVIVAAEADRRGGHAILPLAAAPYGRLAHNRPAFSVQECAMT
jgi:hypothetical protein